MNMYGMNTGMNVQAGAGGIGLATGLATGAWILGVVGIVLVVCAMWLFLRKPGPYRP